jgi:hypothetical protein
VVTSVLLPVTSLAAPKNLSFIIYLLVNYVNFPDFQR